MTIPNTKTALRSLGLRALIDAGNKLEIDGAEEMTKSKLIDAILEKQSQAPATGEGEPSGEPSGEPTGEGSPEGEQPTAIPEPTAKEKKAADKEAAKAAKEAEKAKAAADKEAAKAAKKEDKVLEIPGTPKWLTQMTTWVYVIFPEGNVADDERVTTTALLRAFGRAAEMAKVEPRESAYAVFAKSLKEDGIAKVGEVTVLRMRAI